MYSMNDDGWWLLQVIFWLGFIAFFVIVTAIVSFVAYAIVTAIGGLLA